MLPVTVTGSAFDRKIVSVLPVPFCQVLARALPLLMPVKLYFTTGISNWLCVNSDSVDTQQPITRARGVWVSLFRKLLVCNPVTARPANRTFLNSYLLKGLVRKVQLAVKAGKNVTW